MRWFYSHLNGWSLILSVVFLCSWRFSLAEDIDIDLGGATTASSNASAPPTKKQNSSESSSGLKSVSTQSETSKEAVSSSGAVVNQVRVSTGENGTQVFIDGINLSSPQVQKISNRKLLIKFKKTKLNIPSKINSENDVVKNIRSSIHYGNMAWIVLDVTSVKKWKMESSETGYILNLNFSGSLKTKSPINEVASVEANGGPGEKRLFSRLIDVSYKPSEKGIKIVLTSDGPSKYTVHKLSQPERLVVRFQNTKLEISDKSRKAKDVESQKAGLVLTDFHQIGPTFSPISEVMLTLMPGTIHQIDRDLNQVIITLFPPHTQEKPAEKKGNLNQLVSLDIEAADLSAVVKTLANEAGFDVDFVSPLAGVVNEKFKDIPLKTALATLLAPGSYDFEVQGNTLRVGLQSTLVASKGIMPHVTEIISPGGGMALAQFDTLVRSIINPTNAVKTIPDTTRNVLILNGTPSDIADYKRAIKDLKLDETNSDQITRIVKLNYASPVSIQNVINQMGYLSPVGKISPSGNNLVIYEQAGNMGVLLELIKELDKKPAQVLIESNIVEIDSEKDLNMGINWSASKTTGDPTLTGAFDNPPTGAQGSPGLLTFGTVRSGLNINATLQALETHKKGKIISRPRVATHNGVQATINTTENVVIASTQSTVGPGGAIVTTTTFTTLPLPINLVVTPRVTDDGRITTIVNASITSQTGPAQGSGAPPPTSIQTATTTITTKNGETIVIGGLVREIATDIVNGIPLLSSLPIIGTLFQEHEKSNNKVELVIFITPTLLED